MDHTNDIIIIINEYPEAGLTASISVQHIYYRHELQHKLYYYYYYTVTSSVIHSFILFESGNIIH